MDQSVPTDFSILENIKENIQPSDEGRSASALARIFSMPSSEMKNSQIEQRNEFEQQINNCEELDDPLEPFSAYIHWINENFPSGPTSSNGLIGLLEKCTSYFKDYEIYKNDPRYLKIWLMYAKHSENPINIFVFLYRKQIGCLLSLYYEEYAKLLELNNRLEQANQVYQRGLHIEARPMKRLQSRYNEFRQRVVANQPTNMAENNDDAESDPFDPFDPFPKRTVLGVKGGTAAIADPTEEEPEAPKATLQRVNTFPAVQLAKQKSKVSIFVDNEAKDQPLSQTGGWDDIGTIASRTKENKLSATPWTGETLPQNKNTAKNKRPHEKVFVFRDVDLRSDAHVPVYKTVEVPGRNPEKLDINLDLLHPSSGDEYCLNEVLALMRGNYGTKHNILADRSEQKNNKTSLTKGKENISNNDQLSASDQEGELSINLGGGGQLGLTSGFKLANDDEINLDDLCEESPQKVFDKLPAKCEGQTTTTKIALNDTLRNRPINDNTASFKVPNISETSIEIAKSPTMTMFTKEANNEVNLMFNQDPGKVNLNSFGRSFNHDTDENEDTNLDEYTEHTHHTGLLKRFGISRLPQKAMKDNEIEELGENVAELSMLEQDDVENNLLEDQKISQANEQSNIFLLTPVKRPLAPNSRKGSPYVKKLSKKEGSLIFTRNHETGEKIVLDPFKETTKLEYLSKASPSYDTFGGYFKYHQKKSELKNLQSLGDGKLKKLAKNNFVSFEKTGDLFNVIKQIGTGGYGIVLLIESSTGGELSALKIESPASVWEFYIINTIHHRLQKKQILSCGDKKLLYEKATRFSIIKSSALHHYQDESYLILNYESQGSLLDIVNWTRSDLSRNNNEGIDEILAILFTIELMKTVEGLHEIDIIHGDLKADNCMVKLQNLSSKNVPILTQEDALSYLATKGISLIDFGRAIDLKLFPPGCSFKTSLKKVDSLDCPEIREHKEWTFEIDYHGLASIVHTMLIGQYITCRRNESTNKYVLDRKLKRYWQTYLWDGLFDFLLNPKSYGPLPNNNKLREHRTLLENYLMDDQNNFKNLIALQTSISKLADKLPAAK